MTPNTVGEPEEWEEEWEQERDEDNESETNLLGIHCPAPRRGTRAAAGYVSGGLLPPSRCAITSCRVRPGTPHQTRRPSLFLRPPTTGAPFVDARRCACLRWKYYAHDAWLSAAYWGRARCSSVRDTRTRSTSAAKMPGRASTSGVRQ